MKKEKRIIERCGVFLLPPLAPNEERSRRKTQELVWIIWYLGLLREYFHRSASLSGHEPSGEGKGGWDRRPHRNLPEVPDRRVPEVMLRKLWGGVCKHSGSQGKKHCPCSARPY